MPTPTQQSNRASVELKEYFEKQCAARQAYFDSRILALEKATEVAARVLGDRLAGMNEIREMANDLANRMVTRSELEIQLDKVELQLADLKKSRDEASGKASQTSVLISMALGLVGLVIGIVSLLMK